MKRGNKKPRITHPLRLWLVQGLFFGGLVLLASRAFYLQILHASYLQKEGDARYLRVEKVTASRGMILDRNGEPLAISTPVDSVWADPEEFGAARSRWPALAHLLGMSVSEIKSLYAKHSDREFMYIKRQLSPDLAKQVMALNIPGVNLRREYKRYYPAGPIAGHVVGFTNIDDEGQEGLELAYDKLLRGRPGRKVVIKDGKRHTVDDVANIRTAVDGRNLIISIDSRIQYLAFQALKAAVRRHEAHSGSAVVLDARTGEVLAMVTEPSFNPNNRANLDSSRFRDRAVTDVFEPGSTIKPFTIAAALRSKQYVPDTRVDTAPGSFKIGKYTIDDARDYGLLTVSRVVEKSSNVGASKIALSLPKIDLWDMYHSVGFGHSTDSGLPGEVDGHLADPRLWGKVEHATISFGYGISVTCLQLARAYTALANDGVLLPVTLLRRKTPVIGERVMTPITAHQVREMLELAVSNEGTGRRARVARYQVAGKTGTVRKITPEGYAKHRYVAVFAGMAPAQHPRLVMAVVVNDPRDGEYFGGQVAAPVFSAVMAGALRLLNVPPDDTTTVREAAAVFRGKVSG